MVKGLTGLKNTRWIILATVAALWPSWLTAAPVVTAWPAAGTTPSGVAAASLSGYYAVADSGTDTVQVRGIENELLGTVSRAQMTALMPWMTLDSSADGPSAMCFSDSGRLLFIVVHDAGVPGDAQPSDAILRFDTQTGQLTTFARLNFASVDAPTPEVGIAHFRGRLYVGVAGSLVMYRALANDTAGVFLQTASPAPGQECPGITVDRLTGTLYAMFYDGTSTLLGSFPAGTLTFTPRATFTTHRYRALGWHDHFGVHGPGLFMLHSPTASGGSRITYISAAMARGQAVVSASEYMLDAGEWLDLASTADGALLLAAASGAQRISDSSDTRLSFGAWKLNEFNQVVTLGRGLISPDGEPPGWVIDADTDLVTPRFHPATPDAAAWTIMLLLMSDRVTGDPLARQQVRTVLARYAGRLSGPAPSRTADGVFRHWIDPFTGGVEGTWDPEFATLSTMKIVLAAQRARQFYPDDASIQVSARSIIHRVKNWDAYLNPGTGGVYYKGQAGGGPVLSSASMPFNEGVIFAEQCARYGGSTSQIIYGDGWLNRALWPTAQYVASRTVTGDAANVFQAAFVALYPVLTMQDYRASAGYQTNALNQRLSNMAWTDDNGPRWNTVFSAGTTKGIWGGYNADSITNHPGDVATFTSLMAMSAGTGASGGYTPAALGAYQAYRTGARQTFRTGASILYRRSNVDPVYLPNSAGMPDVALGALGLAELIQPGSVEAVLTGAYWPAPCSAADITGIGGLPLPPDQLLTLDDILAFIDSYIDGLDWADVTSIGGGSSPPDGLLTLDDILEFVNAFNEGC